MITPPDCTCNVYSPAVAFLWIFAKKQIAGYAVDILLAVCYDKSGDFSAAINTNGGIMMKKEDNSTFTADTHIEVLSHSISDVKSEVLWRFH